MLERRSLALLAAAIALALFGTPAEATAAAPGGVIRACYDETSGALRVVRPGGRCGDDEVATSWRRAGVPGAAGQPGHEGERGDRGLRGKTGKAGKSTGISKWLQIAGAILGIGLAALLVPPIAGLAVLQVAGRTPWVKRRWPVTWFLKPTMQVEKLDDCALDARLGPAISGLLRGQIHGPDRYGPDLVTGQQAVTSAVDAFKDFEGTAKMAGALVRFLYATLPRRSYAVSGELQPAGVAGPGLSLALRGPSGFSEVTALWAEAFEFDRIAPRVYQRLAIPAGAWVDHHMTKEFGGLPLSRNPMSWAFFRVGVEGERIGENTLARSLYQQALGHDGRNIGALANLGIMERRDGEFGPATLHLEEAHTELQRLAVRAASRDRATLEQLKVRLDDKWRGLVAEKKHRRA